MIEGIWNDIVNFFKELIAFLIQEDNTVKIFGNKIPIIGLITGSLISLGIVIVFQLIKRWVKSLGRTKGISPDIINGFIFVNRIVIAVIIIWVILKFLKIESRYIGLILGITGTAITFASVKTVNNFIAGIWIAFSQPYIVGDLVKIDDLHGIIIKLSSTYTHIKHPDGNITYIPNIQCLNATILNYTLSRSSFEQKIHILQKNLEKLKDDARKDQNVKIRALIKEIEEEINEKEEILNQIDMYSKYLEKKIERGEKKDLSKYTQRGKFVRYIFTFSITKDHYEDQEKLHDVCKKWREKFGFIPIWDLIHITHNLLYQITIITPDPMDILKYQNDFMTDIYQAIYAKDEDEVSQWGKTEKLDSFSLT